MTLDNLTDEERLLLTTSLVLDALPGLDLDTESSRAEFDDAEFVSDGHLLAIETFHRTTADRFADALSNFLRQPVEVQLVAAETCYYSQFALSRANPTCLITLNAPQLSQPLAIDFSPRALYPILNCLLGGGRYPCSIPDRPPTEIEQRLTRRVVDPLIAELHEAWEPVLAVSLSVDRIDTHAQRVRLVAPHEKVVILTFRLSVTEQTGDLTLCLPAKAIHKMIDKLAVEHSITEHGRTTGNSESTLIQATLGPIEITSDELRDIESGDILSTDLPADVMVTILINGQPKFEARTGSVNGFKAVVIQ